MRGWWVISMLALAGCGEHQGLNPNYRFGATPYGEYLAARETALTRGSDPAQIIPIALPAKAPTAEEIAGVSPVPVPPTMGVATRRLVARKPASQAAARGLPVTSTGPYPGSTPVLVRYAFAAGHAPGTAIHARPQGSAARAAAACARYAGTDAAQMAFLAAGGPRLDPLGLDPDGDGFVCGWDPAPFRTAQP
ncbi:hypothetical protein [Paracoccus spongiarum]|uniref:Excalibur calcium-binding domain-containing protein n=1 Tax=Paracoccus spongiarum TaxID=3064387 RepID=A0ABT9JCI7_9RHOB|nr:hypothetical protein [Paracoccus sp. 2205BS29-5]MDP5307320.1 hypothetical protein [Paracoccus sp. 2205BS29-5]